MVTHLFHRPIDARGSYSETSQLTVSTAGLTDSVIQHPWRQLLILPLESIDRYSLHAGQLKENIVAEMDFDLYALPSGTVLNIGTVIVRLTFHCEPCSKLRPIISPSKLLHQRGYHAQIIQGGTIDINDEITVDSARKYEAIPYAAADRIKWFLAQNPEPIFAAQLMQKLGLATSYCRALPNIIKKHAEIDADLILYKKDMKS